MDINNSIVVERYQSSSHCLTETDFSTMSSSISSCDLSTENKVINLVNQANNKSINENSPNLLLEIKKLTTRNSNKIIIVNLNINSLPFEQLKDIVMQHTDILVLIEIKIDNTFPTVQFLVNGFSEPYRLDRNRNGGGVMTKIPNKWLNMFFTYDMKGLQGIIQKKSASSSWMLPFVIFDIKVPFFPKNLLF